MKKIEFYPSTHTPEETDSAADHILNNVLGLKEDDVDFQSNLSEIKLKRSVLTKNLNSSSKNPLTRQFADDVMKRDLIFTGGKHNIKGFTYWIFDPEKKEAAEKLQEVVIKHSKEFQG